MYVDIDNETKNTSSKILSNCGCSENNFRDMALFKQQENDFLRTRITELEKPIIPQENSEPPKEVQHVELDEKLPNEDTTLKEIDNLDTIEEVAE